MTLRVGIIGAGVIGCDHGRRIASVLSGADVVAVTDVDHNAAERLAAEVDAAVRADGHELIADAGVEAVVIASSAAAHEEHAIAAIEAGKPVFCEKPLAATERAGRNIMAAEVKAGRRLLQVGFMRRYDPAYRELKRTVDGGAVGRPLIFHSTHRTAAAPSGWSGDMAIVDAAVHDFDIARWLLGTELSSIRVFAGKQCDDTLRDPLQMVLETTSGALVTVETSLNVGYGYDIRGEVVGEFGAVALAVPDDGVPSGWQQRFATAYDIELQEWIHAVRDGDGATGASTWDGYVAQVVSDAGIAALRTGEPVAIEPIERPALYE